MKKQIMLLSLIFLCSNTTVIQANAKTDTTIDVENINLSDCDKNGNNAFHIAAQNGDITTMEKLLDKQNESDGIFQSLSWYIWGSKAYPVNVQNKNGDTALHVAIQNNHHEIMRLLLTQGKSKIDHKLTNNKKYTPLWLAAEKGDEQSTKILIAHDSHYYKEKVNGQNLIHHAIKHPQLVALFSLNKKLVNEKDNNGNTPLLHAIAEKSATSTQSTLILLKNGADATIQSKRGLPALHESIHADNLAVTQLILESGVSVDSTDDSGKTALRHAVDLNATNAISFLIRCKTTINKPDHAGNTPVHSAASNGYFETLMLLKEHDANITVQNKKGETIAHFAAHYGHTRMMNYIIQQHKRLTTTANNDGNLPLHTAIYSGKLPAAQLLLAENDFTINAYNNAGNTPLHIALETKKVEFVRLLLNHKADFRYNKKGYSPVHTAAANGFVDGVKTLQEYGARITDLTGDNNTPLHIAFINNHFNCTQLLLNTSVATTKNNKGRTPLHILASKNISDTSVIDLLMNYATDINTPDKKGYTPLAHAARTGNLAMMKKLRSYNASLFTRTKNNDTLLHLAAKNGDLQKIDYLRSMGLSLREKNNNNETPFITAAARGRSDAMKALLTEEDFKDGSMTIALSKARLNRHYATINMVEREIEQRKTACEELKTLQTTIEKLVNSNITNSIVLTHKTSSDHREYIYHYVPAPSVSAQLTLMTTDDIYKHSCATQRENLKQQLLERKKQEEQHKMYIEQRLQSITRIEQQRYDNAIKQQEERKELLNKCQQILNVQNTVFKLIEENKKINDELKEINQKTPITGYLPYAPSSCAQQQRMNLDQLLKLEAEKRAILLKKMLTDQNYEAQKKTYLEQQKLKATAKATTDKLQEKPAVQNNEQIAAECCICYCEKADAKPLPCTSCNKGSERICSSCLGNIMAGNKRCPICNLNTLQAQPKPSQPQMPSNPKGVMPNPLRAGM